jgi:hypothetical protein
VKFYSNKIIFFVIFKKTALKKYKINKNRTKISSNLLKNQSKINASIEIKTKDQNLVIEQIQFTLYCKFYFLFYKK